VPVPAITYRASAVTVGWQKWVANGATAGPVNAKTPIEALQFSIPSSPWTGTVQCSSDVQKIGWLAWADSSCGTTGKSLRLEAVKIRLTGDLAANADVWYRIYAQNIGWMGWASNGAVAGPTALSLYAEAIQVQLLPKSAPAPGPTANATKAKPTYQTPGSYRKIQYGGVAQFGGCGFNLTSGMNGLKVRMVAGKMGVVQYDQSMSPLLRSRVKTFQRKHHLSATGVVDVKTWTAMGFSKASWTSIDCYKAPLRVNATMTRAQLVSAFIATAESYRGSRYVWGGANAPAQGADCSGLVLQALYSIGIDPAPVNTVHHALPAWRSSRIIATESGFEHVPISQVQPGDIVAYAIGSPVVNHNAIYIGNGQIMQESGYGRIASLHSYSGLQSYAIRPIP